MIPFSGNSVLITEERNQVVIGKLPSFSHSNNTKEECPLKKKKSRTKANFCCTLPNILYSSSILSLPIGFYFIFFKVNEMAYLLHTCSVKFKLADQSVCLTTFTGGKKFGTVGVIFLKWRQNRGTLERRAFALLVFFLEQL